MIKKILEKKSGRDLLAISASTLSSQALGLLKGFVVAKFLGPTEYGILKATQLISMLDKYGNLGFKSIAKREVAHFRGSGDLEKSNKSKNVAYSGELLLSVFLFIAGVVSSCFFSSKLIIVAVLLASGQLFSSKVLGIFATDAIIEKKIVLYSKVVFWSGLGVSIFTMLAVPALKIYAVLGVPILASVISCCVYYKCLNAKLVFDLDRKELIRQLRIGIPITVFALSYGSYKYSERILIGTYHGIEALGFYGLACMPIDYVMTLLLLPVKIRSVNIYELLGQGEYVRVHKMALKETALIFLAGLISVPVLCFAVDFLISTFLPEYLGSIIIAKILILSVPIRLLSGYPNIILLSSVVNKQVFAGPVQFVVTGFFIGTVLILKHFDKATIINIVIADTVGYMLFNISCLFLYKKLFYDVYVTKNIIPEKANES